jgi:hypothetical protein
VRALRLLVAFEPSMPDPVQRMALSRTLWLIVAPPLVGFVALLVLHALQVRGLRLGRGGAFVRRIGLGSALLSAAATLGQAVHLAGLAPGMLGLVQQAPRARVGVLEVGLGFALDRMSCAACGLACAVTMMAALALRSRRWRTWAWLDLALAGALLSFLADGFVTLLVGWALSAVAAAWLAGWRDARAAAVRATRGALSVTALLVGAAFVFWGLAARWDGEDYALAPGVDLTMASDAADAPRAGLPSAPVRPSLTFAEIATDVSAEARSEEPGVGEHPAPGGLDAMSLAFAAFVVAAASLALSSPRSGVPFALSAVGSGATFGVVGPYLLLRMAATAPPLPGASRFMAIAGVVLVTAVAVRALRASSGPVRVLALLAGAPTGLTCVSLGVDGVRGGWLVLLSSGSAAALLLLTVAVRGLPTAADPAARPHASPRPRPREAPIGGLEPALFEHLPESAGTLVMSFERWVVDSIAGAVVVAVYAGSWALARFDAQVAGGPTNALADRTVRAGRALEPHLGGSLGRVAWVLLGALLAGVLVHSVWWR